MNRTQGKKNLLVTTTSCAWRRRRDLWSSSSGFRAFNPITPSPPSAGFKTPWRRRGVVCFGLTVRPGERQDHWCPNNERKHGFSDSLSEISLDRGEILNKKTQSILISRGISLANSSLSTFETRTQGHGKSETFLDLFDREIISNQQSLISESAAKRISFFSARKTRENPRRHSFSDARQTTKNPPPQKGVLSTRERVGCLEYTHR